MLSADRARTHGAFLVLLFALQLGLIVAETRISGILELFLADPCFSDVFPSAR
jgi:hypothetical protein